MTSMMTTNPKPFVEMLQVKEAFRKLCLQYHPGRLSAHRVPRDAQKDPAVSNLMVTSVASCRQGQLQLTA
jgi:hypothetical protein